MKRLDFKRLMCTIRGWSNVWSRQSWARLQARPPPHESQHTGSGQRLKFMELGTSRLRVRRGDQFRISLTEPGWMRPSDANWRCCYNITLHITSLAVELNTWWMSSWNSTAMISQSIQIRSFNQNSFAKFGLLGLNSSSVFDNVLLENGGLPMSRLSLSI